MARPNHLSVPNTPEGISRINQLQDLYDRDPQAYEERERYQEQMRQEQEQQEREQWPPWRT